MKKKNKIVIDPDNSENQDQLIDTANSLTFQIVSDVYFSCFCFCPFLCVSISSDVYFLKVLD